MQAISPALAADARKVVIPFDFVSTFDDGRYGRMIGEMVWKKLSREGGYIIPESMLDVREFCDSHKLAPSPETSLERMKKIVQGDFGGQIGIWGSVERAPAAEKDVYDLVIKCVDFSAQPRPKVIYETTVRTKSVSEIPHVYVKQMLDALYERKAGEPPAPDLAAEKNWRNGPNLVCGDFERGADGVPKGWDKVAGQQREPLGGLVRWMADADRPGSRFIHFTLDKQVAENEGVMYYSDFFPIEAGATYRLQCRWRSNGPAAKVFVKCYDYVSESLRRREVYRSQQNLAGPRGAWNTHTEDFTPKHAKYPPKWGRVMLYAYHDPGTVDFGDMVVKQIVAAPSGEQEKALAR